jgi:hypothetical protein
VLAAGGSFSADTNNSIIRTLSFSGISVTDNLYGQQGENLPPGQQFWGVWLANSPKDQDPGADDPDLQWYAARVPAPGASFSVQWSLFSGQDFGADRNQAGTYTVYARFLDGAGNPSAESLSATVTLQPGYTLPQAALPFVMK